MALPACKQAGSSLSHADTAKTTAGITPERVLNFWDQLDFGDTLATRNPDLMEQNFVNFVALGRGVDREVFGEAVQKLMTRAEVDSVAFAMLAMIARDYLYDPNSPMYSEEDYLLFLDPIIASAKTDPARKERFEWERNAVLLNSPGTKASDIRFFTPDGKENTLYGMQTANRVLLVFFDPDCDHCHELMPLIEASEAIRRKVADGKLTVVALYSGDLKDMWREAAASMPKDWIIGIDDGTIDEKDTYILRALPSLYLLDPDKTVVYKDIALPDLERVL